MPSPIVAPADSESRFFEGTVEGLLAERNLGRNQIYRCLLAFLGLAISALPLVRVDVAIQAVGVTRPTTAPLEIRPEVSGTVGEVWISDNQTVHPGQPLLRLRSTEVEARLALATERLRANTDLVADLRQILTIVRSDQLPPNIYPEDPALRHAALEQEWWEFQARLEALSHPQRRAAVHHERIAVLAAKGWSTDQELEGARLQRDETEAAIQVAQRQAIAGWSGRLRAEEANRGALMADHERLQEEVRSHTLRAPTAGVIMDFTSLAPGSFIALGQSIARISPDDALQIEAMISPRDAGLVRSGQRVRLLVDALPHTYWGALTGTVRSVSDDLTTGALTESPGFKVLIEPDRTFLARPDGRRADLRKGLTVAARMVVAQRSLLQLLAEKSGGWTAMLGRTAAEPTH